MFRRFGTILSVHIMIDKKTGLSRGYGFISFSNINEANQAKSVMNGIKVRLTIQYINSEDCNFFY